MRITILGSGAMACLFGARLAPHADVILLGGWREGITAISERGIRIEAGEGAVTVPVRATTESSEAAPADLVLVLVKSWQTAHAAGQAAELLAPGGLALTMQNGLGNLETLAAAVGPAHAALGVTTQGATLAGPGVVREGGRGQTHIGKTADREATATVASVCALLTHAGFETHLAENVESLAWGKVVINCGINPLTAILRVPNGELLKRSEARALMERAAREAAEVARAKGVALPYPDPAAEVREVARRTASNRSSMFQDILRGAPTEIDAINGAVAREGIAARVRTPVNELLWILVRALARPVAASARASERTELVSS